jgi:lysozyme
MKKFRNIFIVVIGLIVLLGILEYKGIIWHNSLFSMKYEVKGLDVSHYQGNIDWKVVAEENEYQFVFIKATEGHDFIDNKFDYNWKEAKNHGILTGAYHFFSMRSSGEEQAMNFINIVPKEIDSLPPVIDIEIHLDHNQEEVRTELMAFANKLEKHYGIRPILYVTYDTYNTYVKGDFEEYDLWIRDIVKFPTLRDRTWLFWQYSNRGRIDGVDTYIDINVFNGEIEDFKRQFSQ